MTKEAIGDWETREILAKECGCPSNVGRLVDRVVDPVAAAETERHRGLVHYHSSY